MAVPIDSLLNTESSDEDFSDSEFSYSSEDESMEEDDVEESSETINETGSLSNLEYKKTEANGDDEFWIRYPYLKKFLETIVSQGMIPEYFYSERIKHIGEDKAKEINEKCKDLSIMELELCSFKYGLISSTISAIKPP
ncbi:unnamed protein product [Cochlearia groenlandica]